uniref:HAT C-terminal dimerisation domain-containing protein n=1 Tax=Octopus bimaculoides TaxID=37653 RepID=A0A0L8H745_OCTBM
MKRLKLTGETRWSRKSNAATTIFGHFDDANVSTFVNLLTCLSMIQDSDKFDAKTKHEANVLLQSLLKFETILTAFTYLYIFKTIAPLSSYLQTSGLDMFTVWGLVDSVTTKLKEQTRTFDNVHSKALEFVNKCNDKILQMNMDENQTLEIGALETALPVKRQRKKKRMEDGLVNDEGSSSDSLTNFRVNVFNLIMDRIVKSLESKFVQHKQLYKDLSCLDPAKFKTIAEKSLEVKALEVTQAQCERTFSKLKIIKTRLRSLLSEENLGAYMLLSIENELLDELDTKAIIDRFA